MCVWAVLVGRLSYLGISSGDQLAAAAPVALRGDGFMGSKPSHRWLDVAHLRGQSTSEVFVVSSWFPTRPKPREANFRPPPTGEVADGPGGLPGGRFQHPSLVAPSHPLSLLAF